MEKLSYAFSVDPGWELDQEDRDLLENIAKKICNRGMSAPAIMALQSILPLGFLGSQAMIAFQPFAELFVPKENYERFTKILERREGVDLLISAIENNIGK